MNANHLLPANIVLEKYPEINYAVVMRNTPVSHKFVAAYGIHDNDPDDIYWDQGHYFESLVDCIHYIDQKLYENGMR